MGVLNKIITLVLAIILFEGPQLHKVDAIEIYYKTKVNISKEINL